MPHPILLQVLRDSPGRYLTEDEAQAILQDAPMWKQRLRAATEMQDKEAVIVERAVEPVLRAYPYEDREKGREKSYRDVALVYRYAVLCMLMDDVGMLEHRLLAWLQNILQSLNFPGGAESIRMTYEGLRREARRALSKDHGQLLDPFLQAAEEILPRA